MGRSLRFGSRTHHYTTPTGWIRPIQTRFRTATPPGLTSRHVPDSAGSFFKGTPSPHQREGSDTDCRHTVSGTISLPSRGTFHHSLTVLFRYRSLGSIQAYRVVPADSQQIPRARCYSGNLHDRDHVFTYGALTVYGRPSQATSTNTIFSLSPRPADQTERTPQHRTHNPCRVSHAYGLAILRVRSPLLTESLLFSLPTGTEMFHFPRSPRHLCIQWVTRHHSCRVSPFGHPRINARLTAPQAYRSLPRPSSAPSAKASTMRPKHLQTQNQKFKRNCTSTSQNNNPPHPKRRSRQPHSLARCSQPLSTNQTPHPTTKDGATTNRPPP